MQDVRLLLARVLETGGRGGSTAANAAWALFFAVLLWHIADGSVREPYQVTVAVSVTTKQPQELVVTYGEGAATTATPPSATVTVRATRAAFEQWSRSERALKATLAADDLELDKTHSVPLGKLAMPTPGGFQIDEDSFTPAVVTFRLTRVVQAPRDLDVQVADVPSGWVLDPLPPMRLDAKGPPQLMSDPTVRLVTAPISLRQVIAEKAPSFQVKQTQPLTLDLDAIVQAPKTGGVEPLKDRVRLIVTIRPQVVEKVFKKRPSIVTQLPGFPHKLVPPTGSEEVTFTLKGPSALLDDPSLLARVRVLAVLPDTPSVGLLNKLKVEVFPPQGVDTSSKDDTYDLDIRDELAPGAGPKDE